MLWVSSYNIHSLDLFCVLGLFILPIFKESGNTPLIKHLLNRCSKTGAMTDAGQKVRKKISNAACVVYCGIGYQKSLSRNQIGNC